MGYAIDQRSRRAAGVCNVVEVIGDMSFESVGLYNMLRRVSQA